MSTDRRWHLVYCKPRQERVAKLNLERQGFVTYLPLVRQSRRRLGRRLDVVEPLFPRYLFIELSRKTDNWAPIRSTLGVTTLVRFGMEPAVVPLDLVGFLRSRETPDGLQDLPPVDFRPGERVRITDGAMEGYSAIFLARSSKERVAVLLDILGKQTRVVIPLDAIEPLAR